MTPTYLKKIVLKAEHVDFTRKLRPSVLMRFFQESCIAHTEELGMGRKMTLDKGFLWIVNSEHIDIKRMPEYDEEITIVNYPGKTLHYFLPRHFIIKDKNNETIIEITAMWSLIDEKTRQIIDPGENGIIINGKDEGNEIPPIMGLPPMDLKNKKEIVANYSLVDINGHLNNASYIDIVFDLVDYEIIKSKSLKKIYCIFKKEIPLGEKVEISYDNKDLIYNFQSPYFAIKLIFE